MTGLTCRTASTTPLYVFCRSNCELAIDRAFAPLLAFDDDEICSAGEPHWYVARDKHANYRSVAVCEAAYVGWIYGNYNIIEDCNTNGQKVRFPVLEHRNAGSLAVPKPCSISEAPSRQAIHPYSYRPECFFIRDPSGTFRGWYAYQDQKGHPAKDYFEMLTSGNNFESY